MRYLLALALLAPAIATAQLRKGADACFDSRIKTVQLRKLNSELTDPVVVLGSNEQLQLAFDDLNDELRFFSYSIVLCDADWSESSLFFSDYIDGFQTTNISQRESSFGTLTPYQHYTLAIPNEQMQIKKSGCYLLKIFDDDKPGEVLLQKSFWVVERSSISAQASVRKLPLAGNPACTQQLELKVEHPSTSISRPYSELKLRVEQNGFRYAQLPNPEPAFVRSGVVDYSRNDRNIYPSGSEYRFFDISSLEYYKIRVREIANIDNAYRVLMEEDLPFKQYTYEHDINGRYVVRNERYKDYSDTQSDYVDVFLSLRMEQPLRGQVYVFGELSGWELSNDCAMLYSSSRAAYELTMRVKQGYYNYRYVYVDEDGRLDFGRFDACSSEAENVYGVFVFYRSPLDRHDRLVNVTWVSSQ
ncbi:MAG: DUF5103 domain-containing protein [Prevotellaceae bacterium]|jgi:hypothetical protein|nr:DUF5103 domain-containing protein [Prevotellaceae bacterium]